MISRLRRVPRYRILCDRIILCAYHAIFCLRKVSSRCSLKAYRHETPFKIRSRLFIQRHANRGGVRWPAQPPKLARQNFRRSNRARQVCKDSPLEGDGFEPSVPPREKPTSSPVGTRSLEPPRGGDGMSAPTGKGQRVQQRQQWRRAGTARFADQPFGGCACPPSGRVSRWPQPALFAQYSQVRQVSTE